MISRRQLALSAIAATIASKAMAQTAPTGEYPNHPIKIIVPLAPGGASDFMARLIADKLPARIGQPVIVENRPGAGSIIGMDIVAKAAPDGYTLGMGNLPALVLNPLIKPASMPYDAEKAFTPISNIGLTPNMLLINPTKVPSRNLKDFVAYLKANPGKLNYGSSGSGSALHVAMELFLKNAGAQMTHVPYKGSSQMLPDLLAGRVDAAMDAAVTSLPHVKEGKLIALGVTSDTPAFFAPDVPPIASVVPGPALSGWHGVVAPAGLPPAILAKLEAAIRAIVKDPDVQERLKSQGAIPIGDSSADFAKFIKMQRDANRPVIAAAGIKAD
ncbi:MAG: tripartite tricarboxylate transporter substrate binding protein [Proteobacteria bacterium]|nr:tripartite tricarboxylate transporter substrate binding protein [Pseudomonadota bacterium]